MSVTEPAHVLAGRLVAAGGDGVRAVLLYGSHLLRASPDRHSAVDLVVIVDAYRPFYRALAEAGELPRPAGLMTALAYVLPPNVIAFAPDEGREGLAKCLIVRADHFARALGSEPRDHFLLGRMVQKVALIRARSAADEAWVRARIAEARAGVLTWMAPWIDGSFDARDFGRRLLEICYGGELRPEARDRAGLVFEAQADHFEAILTPVLERAATNGEVEREPGSSRYHLRRPVAPWVRWRWRRHFRRSRMRATARWLKHTVTFANWLPYVVRKVERHTGREIHLTALERRMPLIFLWPRAIKVLLTRPERRDS